MDDSLDFSSLEAIGSRNNIVENKNNNKLPEAAKKAENVQYGTYTDESENGLKKLSKLQALNDQVTSAYKRQQDIKRISTAARVDIIKSVQAGENPYRLLLKAVECISTITGDSAFYMQIKTDLEAIHGKGLENPDMLEFEKKELEERLKRLEAAKTNTTSEADQKRINTAISEHKRRIQFIHT
ncbi:hypothetical protein RG959_23020 [Domibacillus sp. 8LH]|uniref:hypothetical protein n=1 Tax=Domibacillus sp. 8LH TaxID=3073900 RepID=UPI003175F400